MDLPRRVRRAGAALRQGRGGRGVRAAPRQHRGAVREVLVTARMCTRVEMLDATTEVVDHERRFVRGAGVREPSKTERGKVERAFKRYLRTLSDSKRQQQAVFYDIKDVVGRTGFGIGSAGLPAYNILIEGFNQALENDVVLSIKQGNIARSAGSPRTTVHPGSSRTRATARSSASRAAGAHRPVPRLDDRDKVGYVVAEVCRTRRTSTGPRSPSPMRSSPWSSCSAGRRRRSTASPTRTATRTSSTSRPRKSSRGDRRGPRRLRRRAGRFRDRLRGEVRKDHALFVDAFRSGAFDLVSAVG